MKKFSFAFVVTTLIGLAAMAGFQGYSNSTSLGIFNKLKCSTGVTCTRSTDNLVITSSPTLAGSASFTAANAADLTLTLAADNSDDNGDDWGIAALASGNSLAFQNNTSGSLVTQMSLSTTGVMTLKNGETLTNSTTDDVVTLASDDSDIIFSVSSPLTTDGDATLRLVADASADNGDDWQIQHDGATNSLLFQNDVGGSQATKLTLSSGGNLTVTGTVLGDGGDAMSGFLKREVASTSVSITAAQCGDVFISDSADVMVLPEASTVLGCQLTFVCGTADDFDINPADGTDQIGVINSVAAGTGAAITPSAGDAIRCTDAGSSIVLLATGANAWTAIGVGNGAWTDVN